MVIEVINGATRSFGEREAEKKRGAPRATFGSVKEAVYKFDYANLPVASSTDQAVHVIPAYAHFIDCKLIVTTTWVGGTSLTVGTEQADGTDIDVDGLILAGPGATANLVAGYVVAGRGAQVVEGPDAAGTAHIDGDGVYAAGATGPISSVAQYIVVTAVGTFTAGAATLVVRYIEKD